MRCKGCSKDVQPTQYGRCPLCGAVVEAGAAAKADEKVRRRAFWRGLLPGPPPEEDGPGSSCGGCLAVLIGLPALLACVGLIHVGNRNRWSSDGPGMLVVMIGVAITGFLAAACLLGPLLAATPLGRWLAWLDD